MIPTCLRGMLLFNTRTWSWQDARPAEQLEKRATDAISTCAGWRVLSRQEQMDLQLLATCPRWFSAVARQPAGTSVGAIGAHTARDSPSACNSITVEP